MNKLSSILRWARAHSLWVVHFNTGSCNGCDIEVVVATTPRFDIERFGILLKGSPRHADVIAFTGPLTRQAEARAKRIYAQLSHPKYVIAIGACALSGGPFHDHYNVREGVKESFPVDVFVPGCPPRPEAIVHGLMKLKEKVQSSHE
jgi:NADH-quinone oxidoreductase B subunit